jgi:hypothetical protein
MTEGDGNDIKGSGNDKKEDEIAACAFSKPEKRE